MINKKIIIGIGGIILVATSIFTTALLLKKDDKTIIEKSDIVVTKLKAESFELTSDSKSIKLKDGITLPEEVEVRYFKGESSTNDKNYKKEVPDKLSVGDIVKIKFFIKSENKNKYKFPEGFINIVTVQVKNDGLIIILDVSKLVKESFEINGSKGKGKIELKDEIILPEQVEVKYFKGKKPRDDNAYSSAPPTNLNNGDIVKIKFFIKNKDKTYYKLPKQKLFKNDITFEVKGLKNLINITKLVVSSFQISKSTDDSKSIKLKPGITLPEEVEVRYFKGEKENPEDADYKVLTTSKLSVGDTVKIKFFIKKAKILTHKFPEEFKNMLTLEILSDGIKVIINTSNLIKESFILNGYESTGLIRLKTGITLPEQVEVKYFKGKKPRDDNAYSSAPPTNLKNGDIVKIKFFIKNKDKTYYKLPKQKLFKNDITFEVKGLKTKVIETALKKTSFQVTGVNESGTIRLKTGIILPEQVEVKYYNNGIKNPIDVDYEDIAPKNLKNGDIVKIKFFIKKANVDTHIFSKIFNNDITFKVTDLPPKTESSK